MIDYLVLALYFDLWMWDCFRMISTTIIVCFFNGVNDAVVWEAGCLFLFSEFAEAVKVKAQINKKLADNFFMVKRSAIAK